VAAEIIHDDDVARLQRREEKLLDIEAEALAIDWTIYDARGIDPVATQCRQKGHGLPVSERNLGTQPLTASAPSSQGSHVGFGPGFVNEDKAFRVYPALICSPLLPAPGYLWPVLLAGHKAFF